MQALAALLVTFGYVTLLFFTRPFKREEDDLLEAGLQTCFFLVIASGLLQAIDERESNRGGILGQMVCICMHACMSTCIWVHTNVYTGVYFVVVSDHMGCCPQPHGALGEKEAYTPH